jgi:hypothetical protein
MLADHRRVVPINEPLIGTYLGPFMADLPGADPSEVDVTTFTLRHISRGNGNHFFAEAFRDVWQPGLRALMLDRFGAQAKQQAKVPLKDVLVVIKEPNGSQSADLLMQTLPESRMLFLLRDGRDVVDSELAANSPGAWVAAEFPGLRGLDDSERLRFARLAAYKWLWRTQVVQAAFSAHKGPKLLVRYEDLRRDPATYYRQVIDWLGLEDRGHVDAALAEHAFENIPVAQRGPESFFRSAKPGAWSDNLTPAEQAVVEDVIGSELEKIGYR